MSFNSLSRQALGAFFTLALLLNSGLVHADDQGVARSLGVVVVDGKLVRIEALNKGHSVEFQKLNKQGLLNFRRDPSYQEENLEITDVLVLYHQLFLLVRPCLPIGSEKTLLQIDFKLAGGLSPHLEAEVGYSACAVAIGAFDTVAAYANQSLPIFAIGAAATVSYSYFAVKKLWEYYRVRNDFLELDKIQTLGGDKTGVALEEITDDKGALVDVRLKFRGSQGTMLSQVAHEKYCEFLIEAKQL